MIVMFISAFHCERIQNKDLCHLAQMYPYSHITKYRVKQGHVGNVLPFKPLNSTYLDVIIVFYLLRLDKR